MIRRISIVKQDNEPLSARRSIAKKDLIGQCHACHKRLSSSDRKNRPLLHGQREFIVYVDSLQNKYQVVYSLTTFTNNQQNKQKQQNQYCVFFSNSTLVKAQQNRLKSEQKLIDMAQSSKQRTTKRLTSFAASKPMPFGPMAYRSKS